MTDQKIIESLQKMEKFVTKEVSLAVKKQEEDRQQVLNVSKFLSNRVDNLMKNVNFYITTLEHVLAKKLNISFDELIKLLEEERKDLLDKAEKAAEKAQKKQEADKENKKDEK